MFFRTVSLRRDFQAEVPLCQVTHASDLIQFRLLLTQFAPQAWIAVPFVICLWFQLNYRALRT